MKNKKAMKFVSLLFSLVITILLPQGAVFAADTSNGSELSDWKYTETDTSITLNTYIGTSTDIIVPGVFAEKEGKQVNLKSNDSGSASVKLFPNSATSIIIGNESAPVFADAYCAHMFAGLSQLTALDLTNFNTANATDMWSMFGGCSSLTTIDVSGFNTSNVTSMGAMFSDCESLESLNVSAFDTSNVESMVQMFGSCTSLRFLDLSVFDTSSVKMMDSMFVGCRSLTSVDLSGFHTSNVMRMEGMFDQCSSLISLDLSSFDSSSVKFMKWMFRDCTSLISLNLSNFNTSNVTDMSNIFDNNTGTKMPTIIFTRDGQIKSSYDTTAIRGRKYAGPYYDANGGTFISGNSIESYFNHFVIDDENELATTKSDIANKFIPTKEASVFTGWYYDQACTTPFVADNAEVDLFTKEYMADTILYAGWGNASSKYTVKYDTDGGNTIEDKTVGFHDSGLIPDEPTKAGHSFKGWKRKDAAEGDPFVTAETTYESLVLDNTVEEITLVAVWKVNQYKVDFNFVTDNNPHDISVPDSVTVDYGTSITEPIIPLPENWMFNGWYTDKECTEKYDFSIPVQGDVLLYGKWFYNTPEESETPTESSQPTPSTPEESETPAESSQPTPPAPEESETPTESSQPTQPDTDAPQTGDTTQVGRLIAAFLGSSGILAIAGLKKRKKK